jgi:membrane-associated phospholipid phosphatase
MKKPVSFFLCEYETSDGFGHLLAFLSFTPPFIVAIQTAVYCTLLLCSSISQSAQISVASGVAGKLLLGQLTNEASNLLLKNIIKQPRPFSNSHNYTYTDYGMPSSHSQFMAFLVAIWPFLVERLFRFLQWPRIWELAFQLAACMGTFLIAYGR